MSESLERTAAAASAASAAFHFCLLFLLCHGLLQCTNQLLVASGHCATMTFVEANTGQQHNNFLPYATQQNTMQNLEQGTVYKILLQNEEPVVSCACVESLQEEP